MDQGIINYPCIFEEGKNQHNWWTYWTKRTAKYTERVCHNGIINLSWDV